MRNPGLTAEGGNGTLSAMSKLVSDFLRVAVLLPTAIKTCLEMLRGVQR